MNKESTTCRLCGATGVQIFSKTILQKYDVAYFQCTQCESLQTAEPYWLDESYADSRPIRDVWMVERNQHMQLIVYFIAKVFGLSSSDKILDWGGGNGLLVRMLRDVGLHAYLLDKYAANYYAVGFEEQPSQEYEMITAFELWEHLPYPDREIEEIFCRKPKIHLLSTQLYADQDDKWSYLHPESGKHVFFYSEKAMRYIANKYSYEVCLGKSLHIFYDKPLSFLQKLLLRNLISGRNKKLLQGIFSILTKGTLTGHDFNALRNKGMI